MSIQLEETKYQKNMRYRFANASDHPLKKNDYGVLTRDGYLMYNKPLGRDDEYYDEPYLLYGKMAEEFGKYFFAEGAVEKLKDLGYDVHVDTLVDQKVRGDAEKYIQAKYRKMMAMENSIFLFIAKSGYYPNGENSPQGEEVQLIDTRNSNKRIYGGGSWFVVDKEGGKIWAVQNNGSDGGYWGSNNVVTGGAGAIGCYVPYTDAIANMIDLTKFDPKDLEYDQLEYAEPTFTEGQTAQLQKLKADQEAERKRQKEEAIKTQSKALFSQPTKEVIVAILKIREGTFTFDQYVGFGEDLYEYNKEKFNDTKTQEEAIGVYKRQVTAQYEKELGERSYYMLFQGQWHGYHHEVILKLGLKDLFERMWAKYQAEEAERNIAKKEQQERVREADEAKVRELGRKRAEFIDSIKKKTKEELLSEYPNALIMKSWTKQKILDRIAQRVIQ